MHQTTKSDANYKENVYIYIYIYNKKSLSSVPWGGRSVHQATKSDAKKRRLDDPAAEKAYYINIYIYITQRDKDIDMYPGPQEAAPRRPPPPRKLDIKIFIYIYIDRPIYI